MVEQFIRCGICHAIYRYVKANKKYMKIYNKNKKSSYRYYWDINNLYGWVMSQKLFVNDFNWMEDTTQFTKDFIENYNDDSNEGYFFEVDVQYPENLHNHNDLSFLPEGKKIEKIEKLLANLHYKAECIMHIRI